MRDFKFFRGYTDTLNVMDIQTYTTASFHAQTPEGVMGRINGGGTDIRLFQTTTVTTVNPKWWMKIKIVLQETWRAEPIGLVFISTLLTIVTIIGIAKILSIW